MCGPLLANTVVRPTGAGEDLDARVRLECFARREDVCQQDGPFVQYTVPRVQCARFDLSRAPLMWRHDFADILEGSLCSTTVAPALLSAMTFCKSRWQSSRGRVCATVASSPHASRNDLILHNAVDFTIQRYKRWLWKQDTRTPKNGICRPRVLPLSP